MTAVAEQDLYSQQFAGLTPGGHTWLDRLRGNAMERFSGLGFPTTHDEEWRFTNIAPIARTAFQRAGDERQVISAAAIDQLLFAGSNRLVFVNGRFASAASSLEQLPEGVVAGSLAAALREQPELIEQHLGRYAAFDSQAFVALNTAFIEDGAFVYLPRNAVVERPIHFVFLSTGGAEPTVSHPRTLILAGDNSQATIIETYLGSDGQSYFTNAVTEIAAGAGSVIDHYKAGLESLAAYHVATMQVNLGRSANFTSHSITLGGGLVRNDANAVVDEGCEATLNGFYLVGGKQHLDNHTAIDHAKPNANSHELYKGILDGNSSVVFNGKIFVRKDAQKTDAKQTNKNLVLSEDAVINTKPELQILADDVRCTHGATIGQIDADAIFYLRSRGIGLEQARDLLIHAFARDIIDRVKVEPLRALFERVLSEKLHEHRQ